MADQCLPQSIIQRHKHFTTMSSPFLESRIINTSQTSPVFHLFAQMPPEIKLIWRAALPGSRIVTMYVPGGFYGRYPDLAALTTDESTLDALYHTCKDSHNTLKSVYCRDFHEQLGRPIWFSKELDAVRFVDVYALAHCWQINRHPLRSNNIKYLTIGYPLDGTELAISPPFDTRRAFRASLARIVLFGITRCPHLERITFFTRTEIEFDIEQAMPWLREKIMEYIEYRVYEHRHGAHALETLEFELVHLKVAAPYVASDLWAVEL